MSEQKHAINMGRYKKYFLCFIIIAEICWPCIKHLGNRFVVIGVETKRYAIYIAVILKMLFTPLSQIIHFQKFCFIQILANTTWQHYYVMYHSIDFIWFVVLRPFNLLDSNFLVYVYIYFFFPIYILILACIQHINVHMRRQLPRALSENTYS